MSEITEHLSQLARARMGAKSRGTEPIKPLGNHARRNVPAIEEQEVKVSTRESRRTNYLLQNFLLV